VIISLICCRDNFECIIGLASRGLFPAIASSCVGIFILAVRSGTRALAAGGFVARGP
jgi:hypothetical protein